MKKLFTMVLTMILVLGMTACSEGVNAGSDEHTENALNNNSENSEKEAPVEVLTEIRIQIEDRSYEKLPLGENGPRIPFGRLSDPADADDMLQNAASSADVTITAENDTSETAEERKMKMTIGDTAVTVLWEENKSVDALRKLVSEKPLSIQMSMYGGFEQVGSIGQSLPRNDVQTTTEAGDIVLYSGNQMVVFYGSNSWGYTRLGHITDKSDSELKDLLGNGDVTITIEYRKEVVSTDV